MARTSVFCESVPSLAHRWLHWLLPKKLPRSRMQGHSLWRQAMEERLRQVRRQRTSYKYPYLSSRQVRVVLPGDMGSHIRLPSCAPQVPQWSQCVIEIVAAQYLDLSMVSENFSESLVLVLQAVVSASPSLRGLQPSRRFSIRMGLPVNKPSCPYCPPCRSRLQL